MKHNQKIRNINNLGNPFPLPPVIVNNGKPVRNTGGRGGGIYSLPPTPKVAAATRLSARCGYMIEVQTGGKANYQWTLVIDGVNQRTGSAPGRNEAIAAAINTWTSLGCP
jgi:hypothetical protein